MMILYIYLMNISYKYIINKIKLWEIIKENWKKKITKWKLCLGGYFVENKKNIVIRLLK